MYCSEVIISWRLFVVEPRNGTLDSYQLLLLFSSSVQQPCFIIINTALTQLPPPPKVETCKKNERLLH